MPPGATGEAWTRGPALLLGYWRDPDLTEQVLTPDGWYRTGDLVRVDDDGYVHVVGRVSTMIIRGGSNVSPAEVEAVLRDHPDVREAAVVGLPDAQYGEEVAAAVVLGPAAVLDAAALRAHCAGRAGRLQGAVAGRRGRAAAPQPAHGEGAADGRRRAAPGAGRGGGRTMTTIAAGRRGAARAAGRARPRALRHPRADGRRPGGAGRRRAGRAPRAGQHRAAGLGSRCRVAAGRGRAGGLPADLPALRRAPRRPAARAGDDPRPHRPRRQPLPAGGGRHLPEHRAPRPRRRPRRAAGQAPPHAAGAGDGHDPGRRGARRRGSVRPPWRSRSAPTSSSRRSAGTSPCTVSTWSSARR